MCSFRLSPARVCLATVLAMSTAGCNSLSWRDEPELNNPSARAMAPDPVQIIYRTKTDRLILAGAQLPPCSMATLQIQLPHPHDKRDVGYARLTAVPASLDKELEPGDLPRLIGHATSEWEGEIPLWQIEASLSQLEAANFFRRAKILGAESFLSVQGRGQKLGRPYRAVPEFDAMIVHMPNQASPQDRSAGRAALSRLPEVTGR